MLIAKMMVDSVLLQKASERISLSPVAATTPENQQWSKYTPSGKLELQIDNPQAQNQFTPGDKVMVTLQREGEGEEIPGTPIPQPIAVPVPQGSPLNGEDVLKHLDGLELSVNKVQVAGEKLREYYDNGRVRVPSGTDVTDYLEMTSAVQSHAKEIRNAMQHVRELLNDAGLI